MKLENLLLAALLLLGYAAAGQGTTPMVIPSDGYQQRLCAYSQARIPVQILGKFNSDNRFFVELSSYPYNKPLAKYEAVLENNALVFTIDSDFQENGSQINYRISTTSPVTQTGTLWNSWYTRGQISLSRPAGESDTLNAGMSYLLNVDMDANNPVTLTLSDSSIREIQQNGYQQKISLVASKSADIFIVKAVNACNVPVPASGKVPVAINSLSIIPIKINNQTALCEGNEIEVSYAVNGGSIPESARFKLRIFKPYASGTNARQIFEVAATKKADGVLVARIPENMSAASTTSQIAILVDKPGLVSAYLQPVSIYPKPVASFRSQSESARIGEAFSLWLNVSGPEPYTVELNNGVSYTLDGNLNAYVYPAKTETYSIRSLRTGCGVTTDLPKQSILVTVPAGIAINIPSNQKWAAICENQKVRLPFVTNAVLTANTKFTVEGITYNNTVYSFEAKVVNDSIEFLVPHSPAEWITEGYFNIRGFRIKTSNPSLTSEYRYDFIVRGIPRVSYRTSGAHTLAGQQYFEYALNVSGGTPYTVTDAQGELSSGEYSPMAQTIFVPATGAYGPKSVRNGCYSNSDLAKLNLTVSPATSQAPGIVVHPPTSKYLCDPDSVEVYFETQGKFGDGNVFQITRSDNSNTPLLTVNKPGRYKVRASLINVPGYTGILVKATNPAIQAGAAVPFIIDSKPVLQYPGELGGTLQNPRTFGIDERPYINTQLNSMSPYTAEYSDGVRDYHFEQQLQYDAFYPVLPRSKVTPYTLKSLTNACGTTDVNLTTYLFWIGYNLSMKYFPDDQYFCAGQEMVVPFNLEKGNIPAGTTYHLQVSKGAIDFKTVASKTTLEDFRYAVPDTMTGEYFVRIVTDAGIQTGGKRFFVNKAPAATVSLGEMSSQEIEYGQSVNIDYHLTGGGPWELIVNGQGNFTADRSPVTSSYTLSRGAVFELKSVSNRCGYGTVSGSVAVRIKPRIVNFQIEKISICDGESINVKYQIGGDIPAGEKVGFYIKNTNGTRIDLTSVSTMQGALSLPVSATLPGGSYEFICYITGTAISESRQISINRIPDIELIGNTTINAGQRTSFLIRSTGAGNLPVDVTLSDGTQARFSPYGLGAVQYVWVTPAATTTYTIASAQTTCGKAKSSGTVTVTVNPPAARTATITGVNRYNWFCEKDTMLVYYSLTGTFSAGNQFTVQFLDKQGKQVNSLPATGDKSPLTVMIPTGFSTTELYRIRLAASDANTASGDYAQLMTFGAKSGASFASTSATLDQNGNAKAVVLLTGTGPWEYRYGNDLGVIRRYAEISPDTLLMTSKEPSAYFKIMSVANGCGAGTVLEPSTIKLEVVLGAEEPGGANELVAFGPNPTDGRIFLRFQGSSKRRLSLYSAGGRLLWVKNISGADAEVNMHSFPSGSYLLKVEYAKGAQTLKVVKE